MRNVSNKQQPALAQPEQLSGYQIVLRAIDETDLEKMRQWRNLDEVRQMMCNSEPISQAQQTAWFQNLRKKNNEWHFVIQYRGQDIGVANLKSSAEYFAAGVAAEVGLYIGVSKYRDNLLAFAPNLLLIDYCFNQLGLESLTAVIVQHNQRALQYNQTLGYQVIKLGSESAGDDIHDDDNQLIKLKLCKDVYKIKTTQLRNILSR